MVGFAVPWRLRGAKGRGYSVRTVSVRVELGVVSSPRVRCRRREGLGEVGSRLESVPGRRTRAVQG